MTLSRVIVPSQAVCLDKEWAKMHRKTIGCIRQCIKVSVFHHVSQETKADTLWKKLESLYERKTAQNKAFAIRKLAHLKLKEGRSVAEHLSEFQDLVNQLTRMNLVVDDELQALLLLSSLPDSWETLVVSLSNFAPNGVLQLAMVKDSLFNEETRRKDMGKDDAQALVTENRGRSRGRNSKGRGKSRSQSQTKGKVKCFYCDKEGHIKRNCKAWKNKQETNQKKADDHNCHVADPYDEWVIDSVASYHVTSRREFFTSYKAGNLGRVKMGNKSYADIVGISDICVETNSGYTLKLKDSMALDMRRQVLGTPIHNGVAKRINRTIVEKVRCMLRMAKLPKSFWVEAVQTACYLINRSPSISLDFDIPERVWTEEDVSYAHLKVFGCKTFAHVPKEQKLKLDDKATPCIFVGYGDEKFGYKLWDPKKKKMIRSRDVVFHENENIKDFEKSEKSKSTVEGVSNLTPTSSSSDIATDIEEVQVENYGDEPAGVDGDDAIDTKGVEQGEQPIPPEMEEPQVRRSTKERHPSTRYSTSEYVLITDEGELESFQEVQSHKDKQSWMKAMHEEMNSLHKNNTYELVELPKGKKALRNKWVFKLKKDGEKLVNYKARLVVKGFNQKQGIDFDEIFSSSDDMLIVGQDANMVGSLKNELFKSFDMKNLGPAIQILGMQILRDRKAKKLWLSQEKYVERVLERFNMKYAKPISTPLGGHFKLSKKSCPSSNKEKENMTSIPYSSAVGSLMYAMVCIRPDIAHVVGVVSRFIVNLDKEHWKAVKWIFRYLRGSSKSCLSFGSSKSVLEGYTDADMAGDLDGRKSTSGFLFTFARGAVSWQSKLQKCVALSTTEAEYIAATEAGKEMLWMKRFLQDLGLKQDEYVVHCDSQGALDLSKNFTYHSQTKHIDVRYH
uniref:CCHC-type domain-containing protein n=1 Tax=Fagus sylvatica TaxID=28930 RepID=A0A2N9IAG3_FAGSY